MKQNHKKEGTAWICLALLLLCGCASNGGERDIPSETVTNIFSEPDEETQADTPDETQAPSPTDGGEGEPQYIGSIAHGFGDTAWEEDDHGIYREYNGGEMVMSYDITATGITAQNGVGILLFLDGQPQPYKCTEEDTYSYLHTFYPTDGETYTTELIFTPVTGQAGDMLEIYSININDPDYRSSDGSAGMLFTSGSVGAGVRLKFNAAPEKTDYPLGSGKLLSQNISRVDVTSAEIRGWSDSELQKNCEYHLYVNDHGQGNMVLRGITAEEPVDLRFEVWGSPHPKFGLIFFVDNQPISADPEDIILFDMENGKKVVVEAQIDLSDFDGESYIYAVLVPRNYRSSSVKTRCFIAVSKTFYLYGDE